MGDGEKGDRARFALSILKGGVANAGMEMAEGGDAAPDLSHARRSLSLDKAREHFARICERAGEQRTQVATAHAEVLADAETAMRKLDDSHLAADISERELVALEAIVVPDGSRPALFVHENNVDPAADNAGGWAGAISVMQEGIGAVAPSVGRISIPAHARTGVGTGFVVAPGLVMTNRHVLQLIASETVDGGWRLRDVPTIDFAVEFGRPEVKRIFQVTGVAYAGPQRVDLNGPLDIQKLDLALLTVATEDGEEPLPPPLKLLRPEKPLRPPAEVYVMGYPAMPRAGSYRGDVLMRVFNDEYFVKRFAPGHVLTDPDSIDDGGHRRVFTHDASTLGGNSGSSVVEFRIEGKAVVGLHFGGIASRPDGADGRNYAHAVARLAETLAAHGVALADA